MPENKYYVNPISRHMPNFPENFVLNFEKTTFAKRCTFPRESIFVQFHVNINAKIYQEVFSLFDCFMAKKPNSTANYARA